MLIYFFHSKGHYSCDLQHWVETFHWKEAELSIYWGWQMLQTEKGPSHLWSNLWFGPVVKIFLLLNRTWVSMLQGGLSITSWLNLTPIQFIIIISCRAAKHFSLSNKLHLLTPPVSKKFCTSIVPQKEKMGSQSSLMICSSTWFLGVKGGGLQVSGREVSWVFQT